MSTEDELRKAVRLALAPWVVVPLSHLGYIADAVLALPELAALIADAERVRELEDTVRNAVTWMETGFPERAKANLRRALDGDR